MIEFELTGEYIELTGLLKFLRLSESGGQAKMMVDKGLIRHNGEIEYRRRAKLRQGDLIEVEGTKILIV
jgi:ribosome-associated protein